tara:strand:+ start:192 stop:728 length:537 start_codon:yes stop_codon:yes gene_type:complete
MKRIPILIAMTLAANLSAGSIYSHQLVDIDGNKTSLKEHEGKVLLIVNVASKCGFTGQYSGLEKLYQEFKDQGLVVCGFPCNQFGKQEPGTEKEIKEFCSLKYNVTFPMYAKVEVKGRDMHSLYEELVGGKSPINGSIKWNFTKILTDRGGKPIKRFSPLTSPTSNKIRKAIKEALGQ